VICCKYLISEAFCTDNRNGRPSMGGFTLIDLELSMNLPRPRLVASIFQRRFPGSVVQPIPCRLAPLVLLPWPVILSPFQLLGWEWCRSLGWQQLSPIHFIRFPQSLRLRWRNYSSRILPPHGNYMSFPQQF